MHLLETRQANTVYWNYQELSILATLGHSPYELDQIDSFPLASAHEISPFKREATRSFCALFQFQPPLDLTVTRFFSGNETSLMVVALDQAAAQDLHDRIASHLSFTSISPSPVFLRDMRISHPLELSTYMNCQTIAQILGKKVSAVFGAMYFANFLNLYKGVAPDEAEQESFRRYGLPLVR